MNREDIYTLKAKEILDYYLWSGYSVTKESAEIVVDTIIATMHKFEVGDDYLNEIYNVLSKIIDHKFSNHEEF